MDEEMGNREAQGGRTGNEGVKEEVGLGDAGSWKDGAIVGGEGRFWDGELEEDEGDEEIGGRRR